MTSTGGDASETTSAMGDRRGLSDRTSLVRIAAVFGIVLFLLAIILANLFYGFDGTLQRLLVLSIGHLLLTPLAFIASLRLGVLLTIGFGVAGLVLLLDTLQLVIRAFYATLTIEYVVLLAANMALAGVSSLQTIAIAKLRKADRELNDGVAGGGDSAGKRAAMVSQESNALRAIAVFAIVALVVVLLALAMLGDFNVSAHYWTLLLLGHVLVAGVAALGAPSGGLWVLVLLGLAALQTALDLLQFTLRLLDRPDIVLEVLSLSNIVTTTLLIISVVFIIIDVAYITSGFGLLSALNTDVVAETEDNQPTKTDTKARATPSGPGVFHSPAELHGAPVRRRK